MGVHSKVEVEQQEKLIPEEVPDAAIDRLIEAIVLRAMDDYKCALEMKDIEPQNSNQKENKAFAQRLYGEVRNFFRSQWYGGMCKIPGERFLKKVEEDHAKKGKG